MLHLVPALFIALCWGSLSVLNKYVLNKLNSSTVMCMTNSFYFLLFLGFVVYNQKTISSDIKKITPIQYFCLFLSALFGIFISNVLYYYYLKRSNSSIFTAVAYSAPLFTLIGAYLFLNETVSRMNLLGIVLIIGGVFLVSK
jgi:drug/metabolite transporter (DMT)-like permease